MKMNIEQMLIMSGEFLDTEKGNITGIDSDFLKDLILLISVELERREAQIH